MTVMEFEEMLLHDFFLKLHYYHLKEEQAYRAKAELVRLQTLTLVNIQLLVFPWERDKRFEEGQKKVNMDSVMKMSKLL